MLSNLSKVLEKIVKKRLMYYLDKFNLLSKYQYGFRPGIGTENALYSVSKFIYDSLDKNKKTLAIFLDLAKAFDSVDHSILVNILISSFGIKNSCLNWFKNYLLNRKQKIKIN